MRAVLLVIRLLGIAWVAAWMTLAFAGIVLPRLGVRLPEQAVSPHPAATFFVLTLYASPGAAAAYAATRLRRRLELRHPPRGFDVAVAAPRQGHE